MRSDHPTIRTTVIAVSAVAALAGAGVASPQIVNAVAGGTPIGRAVVAPAEDHLREVQGRHHRAHEAGDDHGGRGNHAEPGDDRGRDQKAETDDSGVDSPRDRAERKDDHGNHLEPGDDHGNHAEPGDDHGRRGSHAEPGDNHGNHAKPGDNHGGRGNHAEPGDDHGNHAEPGDDHGGHGGSDD